MTDDPHAHEDAASAAATTSGSPLVLRNGKSAHKQKRAAGLVDLTPRHRLLAEYMACGTDHARAKRLGLPLNAPLSLEQACAVLDIRRRNGREITALPEWQKLYLRLVSAVRSGEHGRSVATLIAMRDREGANSAADAKVRINASKALLGEAEQQLAVSVSIDNRTQIRPGYIIKCPQPRAPITIEGTAATAPVAETPRTAEVDSVAEFRRRWAP